MYPDAIHLVYADQNGRLYPAKDLLAVGMNGRQAEVANRDWIDLPPGGEVMLLPGRLPLGFDEASDQLEVLEGFTAVAAILPVGLTRALLPGYESATPVELPLFGYTAVGVASAAAGDKLKVAAIKTDEDLKWNPLYYNTHDLPGLIERKKKDFPANRILKQLAQCALEYHCLTAQNIFYARWEAGIPVSPVCNARCRGCISEQPAECCPAPQGRIAFTPTVAEVAELAAAHLEQAGEGIVSFGQGCEGEPSLQGELLARAIDAVRARTHRGTLNMNSNAGDFTMVRRLVDAGLDSIRISLFSAVSENYQWYHRPQGYQLNDVIQSVHYAVEHGLSVALNLLFFPGFTNQLPETQALYQLIAQTGIHQVQLRNLNIDPEKLEFLLRDEELPPVAEWLADLRRQFPQLRIGNYTTPKTG